MKTTLALFAAFAALSSCTAPPLAERATFDAIAPDYAAYVQADTLLDMFEKNRRLLLVESWRERLTRAEAVFK
jgi:hypothetical protein